MDLLESLSAEMAGLAGISSGTAALINKALPTALGPPGVEGDPEAICHVADRMADGYRAAVEFSIRFRQISTNPEFQKLVTIASGSAKNMIREIEEFSERLLRELPEAYGADKAPGGRRVMTFDLTLTAADVTELNAELERLQGLADRGRRRPGQDATNGSTGSGPAYLRVRVGSTVREIKTNEPIKKAERVVTFHRARKTYPCVRCGEVIPVGALYARVTPAHRDGTVFLTGAMCLAHSPHTVLEVSDRPSEHGQSVQSRGGCSLVLGIAALVAALVLPAVLRGKS